jgi:hypothetical protein
MMSFIRIIPALLFSFLIHGNVCSQDHPLKKLYFERMAGKNDFIAGKEYLSYYFRSNTTPLFHDGKEFEGTLTMNGRTYTGIKLQYDTFLDELLYTIRDTMINFQYPKLALNRDMINSFTLEDESGPMRFIKYGFSATDSAILKPGFYEIVEEGKSRLLIRHQSRSYKNQAVFEYRYAPEYFLSKGSDFLRVKNKADIDIIFGAYSFEIRDFLRSTGKNIRKPDKAMLTAVMRFYNSLNKQATDGN